nr:PHP domain-containing protein [Chloroflexota bacterium]
MTLRPYLADLHVHTVLSACAEVEMIPPLIVKRAGELALGIIAITDHNSAENVAAVMEAAQGFELRVLPGMEVQTKEEVHLLCLFDSLKQVLDWQDVVYAHLPPLRNNPEFFGPQFVVDATGDFVRYNEKLLSTATSLSVEEVVTGVVQRGGLCIAAHIDRPSFSLLANLGFVPPGVPFAAMEITRWANANELQHHHPSLVGYSFICSGDAHRLDEMCNLTILTLAEPTIAEISLALRGEQGRKVKVLAT